VDPDEIPEGAIIAGLGFLREAACRQLLHSEVVLDAVAAHPFLIAGIGTVAFCHVSALVRTIGHFSSFREWE